jgi:hypothetical protein
MKTVIFYFGVAMKDVCWRRDDIILFNGEGWWLINGASRVSVLPSDLIAGKCEYYKYNQVAIIEKLRSWGPIWSRWCGKGDQYELLLRDALLLIIQIADGLQKLGVRTCIMHTGVAHHIDSVIFELACEQAKVKPIYLYAQVFSNRLVPLEINGGITQRTMLGAIVSKHNYTPIISDFLENNKRGKPPKLNVQIKYINTAWSIAILFIIKNEIINIARSVANRILGRLPNRRGKEVKNIFRQFHSNYFLRNAMQVLQQRDALTFISRNTVDQDTLNNLLSRDLPKLIIAAHYQPEATSFPEGGEYGNHVDIAIALRSLGYKEPILYKEHKASFLYMENGQPTRVGMYRSRQYFKHLQQIGCLFVSPEFNLAPSNHYSDTFLPVTITGSIALERSLAGLHTIVAGYPWFKGMPGILQLAEIDSLDTVKSEWVTPDSELARRAFEFLEDSLSGKTMTNAPGIGTGVPLTSNEETSSWAAEFQALLQHCNLMDSKYV